MISNYSKDIRVQASVSIWKNLVFVFVNATWVVQLVVLAAKKTTMMHTNVSAVKYVLSRWVSVSSIDYFFGRFLGRFMSMHIICTYLRYKTHSG